MDVDASAIFNKLEQLQGLPTPVSSWLVETGTDSTDDRAVWVWAFLKFGLVDRATRFKLRQLIRDVVHETVKSEDIWVYIRFPNASDREQFE